MAKTVDDLRNEIRVAVGRYERVESTAFTKESLAAICEAVGYDIDHDRFPPKEQMRTGILETVGHDASDRPDRVFRKAELEAVAAAVTDE
jgi:hypothetical protein